MNLMFKKAAAQFVVLALLIVFSGSELLAQKRISFRRGASSATVRGRIGPNGYLEYVINGRAGQLMSVDITSGNGAVIVNAGSASGKNFSIDMTGGDHVLSIVNTSRAATGYVLTVSIN
jgi:hypothetical protein